MTLGTYLVGAADLLCVVAPLALASRFLARRRLPGLTSTDRFLAAATIFTAGLLASHVIPLCLGILSRLSVLVAALGVSALFVWLARRGTARRVQPAVPYPPPLRRETGLVRGAAVLITFLACVVAVGFLSVFVTEPVNHVDFMEFHATGVARWIQKGSMWSVVRLFPTHISGYEPNNGEVLLLAVTLPWRSTWLTRLVNVPALIVLVVALVSFARHLRVTRSTALLYSVLAASLPVIGLLGLNTAKPDILLFAAFAVGALFLYRHVTTGAIGDLVIAGIALGITFGTKWNGMPAVAIVLLAWAAGRLTQRVPVRRVATELAGAGGLVLAFGGIWLIRNAVITGNPLFPLRVKVAGVTILSAPENTQYKRLGGTIAQYLTDPHALRHYILPSIYKLMLGAGGVLLVALVFAAGAVALRPLLSRTRATWAARERPSAEAIAAISVAAVLIGVVYLVTPYSAQRSESGLPDDAWVNVRYGFPALLLAVPCAAWLTDRAGRLRTALVLLALFCFWDAAHRSFGARPWYVSPLRLLVVAAVVLAAITVVAAARRPAMRLARRLRLPATGLVAAAALAALLVAGFFDQRHLVRRGYSAFDPTIAWVEQHAPANRRIGLTGYWRVASFSPELAMFGPRLRNSVTFVGPVRRGIVQEFRDPAAFKRAVRRGRFDFVLVEDVRDGPSREERWLRQLGFSRVAASPWLHLLKSPAQ